MSCKSDKATRTISPPAWSKVIVDMDANAAVPHGYTYDALGRPKTIFYAAAGPADVEYDYDYDTVNSECTAGHTFALGRLTASQTERTELNYYYALLQPGRAQGAGRRKTDQHRGFYMFTPGGRGQPAAIIDNVTINTKTGEVILDRRTK